MFIKLLGENSVGLPLDCTIGKVYETIGRDEDGALYFFDDVGEENYAYDPESHWSFGKWQEVNEKGEPV